MTVKAKSLMLENFANFDKITVNFDSNLTYLVGPNGSGKSTLGLYGFQFVMEGIAEKTSSKERTPIIGERYNFIGANNNFAKGHLVLYDDELKCDIVVKRRITAKDNSLSFEAPESVILDQKWLSDLFNVFMLSPKYFESLSPQQQAILLGVDTSMIDEKIKETKQEYTFINRQIKGLGDVPTRLPDKMEEVNISALYTQMEESMVFNRDVDISIEKRKALEERIKNGEELLKSLKKDLKGMSSTHEKIDIIAIQERIDKGKIINEQATNYNNANEKIIKKKELLQSLEENKELQSKYEAQKIKFIKAKKLPFENLSINDEGGLLLDDKYIRTPYFSTGELINIITELITSQNPDLKYIYLQDFNLLDEEKQRSIIDKLTKQGYQLVVELISGEKMEAPNVICLNECKIVGAKVETEKPKEEKSKGKMKPKPSPPDDF